jgi:excisionase family DNA binding protein
MEDGISTGTAAQRVGLSQQYIYRLVKDGRIKAVMTDLGYLVDPHDLARFAAERGAKKAARKARKAVAS